MNRSFDLETRMIEVVDRCRRMETRMTKFLESQGFDTLTSRPRWSNGTIYAPSVDTSMRSLLSVIPADWPIDEEIYVTVKGDPYMSIFLPTTMPRK